MSEEEFSAADIEAARVLFAGPCDFVLGVAALPQLPFADRPEIAFAGRSNVGKSSLVNALTGRKTLANVSNTPGRTQQLNFFDLGGKLYMVDMPGYGYAKVSKDQRSGWQDLIRAYLRGRPSLRSVFILIDSRVGFKESDLEIMEMLDETAVSYRIVLTKVDKMKAPALEKIRAAISGRLEKRAAAHPDVLSTSAEKGMGIPEMRAVIREFTTVR